MRISKYQGLGNDFVIVDYEENMDYEALAIKCCNRHIGIGADGLIVVKQNPLEMVFYNSDGSIAKMCGNGIRCFGAYCLDNNIVDNDNFNVLTGAGDYLLETVSKNPYMFKVNMGKPIFSKESMNMDVEEYNIKQVIQIKDKKFETYNFFMGTMHTVLFLKEDYEEVINSDIPYLIHKHEMFKDKTNVNLVKVIDSNTILNKTYERGVGYTKACGTGSCAAVIAGILFKGLSEEVVVKLEYGDLKICSKQKELPWINDVFMIGEACKVFEGTYGG